MLELYNKYFKAAIIKMLELVIIRKCLKQMKTIESLSKEMETLSKDAEDIKNPMDMLELKITFKIKLNSWIQQQSGEEREKKSINIKVE